MPDEKMNKEIQEAIQKHLPGRVCEEVRKALEENQTREKQIEEYKVTIIDLNKRLDRHKELAVREEEVREREREVIKREVAADKTELRQDKTLLEKDVRCEKAIAENAMELVRNLTKNVMYKEQVYGSRGVTQNGCTYNEPYDHSSKKTIETDDSQ